MTPEQFYAETVGKRIDVDGYPKWQPYQCIDLFRYWGQLNNVPIPPTPNNYADGYWYSRDALGFSKYFEYITDPALFTTGTWVFWARGSRSHSSSHVAMYMVFDGAAYEFGENQGGNASACLKTTDFSDALGGLRWKGYIMTDKTIEQLAYEVIAGMWGNGEERKERLTRAGYDYDAVQAKVDEIMAHNQVEDPDPTPEPDPEPTPEPETPEIVPELPSGWSNEFFDIMRYLAEIGLPALSVLVATIGQILGLPKADKIAAVIMAVSVFVGSMVGIKRKQYNGGER